MLKTLGVLCMLGGSAGIIHSWVQEQKERQIQLEAILTFLQKFLCTMKNEKIRVMDYFGRYIEQEGHQKKNAMLVKVLKEMMNRLSTNTYPNGQMVWEEVFREMGMQFQFDQEIFQIVVQAGNGFFGRSREENVSFLNKSIKELEKQKEKLREKNVRERKVWIPVGMLGTVMLVILFL